MSERQKKEESLVKSIPARAFMGALFERFGAPPARGVYLLKSALLEAINHNDVAPRNKTIIKVWCDELRDKYDLWAEWRGKALYILTYPEQLNSAQRDEGSAFFKLMRAKLKAVQIGDGKLGEENERVRHQLIARSEGVNRVLESAARFAERRQARQDAVDPGAPTGVRRA